MDYYSNEEIASVIFYNLRLAEDELQVYEACINFVLENCPESQLMSETGCEDRDNLRSFQDDLVFLLKKFSAEWMHPERFKDYDTQNCIIKGLTE